MLASCENCVFRQAAQCELGVKPDEGELYCKQYKMSEAFRDQILALVRKDVEREISRATLMIQMHQAEDNTAFAG